MLQVRKAALRAALSTKLRDGKLVLVDRMVLDESESEKLLIRRIEQHIDVLQDLDQHRVKHAGHGFRQWVINAVEGEIRDDSVPVVDFIMNRLKEDEIPIAPEQGRTGAGPTVVVQ